MDVRAVDTSTMAAKRVELESGHPNRDRRVFTVNGITQRTSHEAGGQVGRSKSSTERGGGQEREHEHEPERHPAHVENLSGASELPPAGAEHILDVRV